MAAPVYKPKSALGTNLFVKSAKSGQQGSTGASMNRPTKGGTRHHRAITVKSANHLKKMTNRP